MLGPSAPVLLIVGARDFGFSDTRKLISELKLDGRVRILEDVSDSELPAFYRHAACFVYPSWAEGFGMPVVEAFSSGIPVICSDTTALSEIASGAAITIAPNNADGLADAIRHCLNDENRRFALTREGLRRAATFDWDQSASLLRKKYSELVCRNWPHLPDAPKEGVGTGVKES